MRSTRTCPAGVLVVAFASATILAPVTGPLAAAANPGLLDRSALTLREGDLVVTDPGAVVEDVEIRGSLTIAAGATGVVVRNVWVYSPGFWTVYVEPGASATFDHVEIGHPDVIGERGIGGDSIVARHLDIHDVEDGVKLGSNSTYEGISVHDLASRSTEPHADAVQVEGSVYGAVIRNSSLDATGRVGLGNAALQIGSDLGPVDNLRFEGNYLNGGAYSIFVDDAGYGLPTNVVFADNRFGPDRAYGFAALDGPVFGHGNVDSAGQAIDLGSPPVGIPEPEPPGAGGSTTTVAGATTGESTPTTAAGHPSSTAPVGAPGAAEGSGTGLSAEDVGSPADRDGVDGAVVGAVAAMIVAAGGAVEVIRRRARKRPTGTPPDDPI